MVVQGQKDKTLQAVPYNSCWPSYSQMTTSGLPHPKQNFWKIGGSDFQSLGKGPVDPLFPLVCLQGTQCVWPLSSSEPQQVHQLQSQVVLVAAIELLRPLQPEATGLPGFTLPTLGKPNCGPRDEKVHGASGNDGTKEHAQADNKKHRLRGRTQPVEIGWGGAPCRKCEIKQNHGKRW